MTQPGFDTVDTNTSENLSQVKIKRTVHDKENPFAQISRALLRDNKLSFRARGLLCYMLSFPNNWEAHPQYIAKEAGIGKDQIYNILKELIEAGYCRYIQPRKDKSGRFTFGWYEFSENAIFKKVLPNPENTDTDNADPANTDHKNNGTPNNTVANDDDDVSNEVPKGKEDNSILKDDVYSFAIRTKKDWTTDEIEAAYLALKSVATPISDHYAYLESIINNKRFQIKNKQQNKKEASCTKKKSNRNKEEEKCLKEKSDNIKSTPLAPVITGHLLLNLLSQPT